MAEIFVRHTLNPHKAVKFNLNLKEYVLKGGKGDSKWLLEVGTTETTSSGITVKPVFVHKVSEDNFEDEVEKAVAKICTKLDWSDYTIDKYAPFVSSFKPAGEDVYIKSAVEFSIEDKLPSAGIDLSGLKVTLNNGDVYFDITPEVVIKGDPYKYEFTWYPPNINE